MLSEEEKKAIKYFYNLRSTIDESYMLFDEEINVKCGKETIKQISLVLNLITKLQKENELAKEQLKKQCKIADERNDLLVKVQELKKEIQDYKYLYEQALDNTMKADKENIQLKKQINLMAEYIANRDNDEDICKHQVAEWCEDEEDGVLIEVCRKCIKQYFERKCEE